MITVFIRWQTFGLFSSNDDIVKFVVVWMQYSLRKR